MTLIAAALVVLQEHPRWSVTPEHVAKLIGEASKLQKCS